MSTPFAARLHGSGTRETRTPVPTSSRSIQRNPNPKPSLVIYQPSERFVLDPKDKVGALFACLVELILGAISRLLSGAEPAPAFLRASRLLTGLPCHKGEETLLDAMTRTLEWLHRNDPNESEVPGGGVCDWVNRNKIEEPEPEVVAIAPEPEVVAVTAVVEEPKPEVVTISAGDRPEKRRRQPRPMTPERQFLISCLPLKLQGVAVFYTNEALSNCADRYTAPH